MPETSRPGIRKQLTVGERRRALLELAAGVLVVAIGLVVIILVGRRMTPVDPRSLHAFENLDLLLIDLFAAVAGIAGMVRVVSAILTLFPPWPRGSLSTVMSSLGYRTFAAWRYLLVWPVR